MIFLFMMSRTSIIAFECESYQREEQKPFTEFPHFLRLWNSLFRKLCVFGAAGWGLVYLLAPKGTINIGTVQHISGLGPKLKLTSVHYLIAIFPKYNRFHQYRQRIFAIIGNGSCQYRSSHLARAHIGNERHRGSANIGMGTWHMPILEMNTIAAVPIPVRTSIDAQYWN